MKVAIVTGAQQGIGRAIALGLARQGAAVAINYLDDRPAADVVAKEIQAGGGRCCAVQGDVSRAADVERLVSAAEKELGEVDVLVNNAGIFPRVDFLELSESVWDKVHGVNLKGTFLCAQAVARRLVKRRAPGAIVNVTSMAAYRGSPRGVHYVASKGGVVGFTRALALELAPHGIRVNAVAPGLSDTAQPRDGHSEAELKGMAELIPLGRMAPPESVADVALFLASDAARHMTGQVVHVNGGMYLGGEAMIKRDHLRTHLRRLWERNQYFLAPDMKRALERAEQAEERELSRLHFTINLTSLAETSEARVPLCGDTGLPMYYAIIGEKAVGAIEGGMRSLLEELRNAVAEATRTVPMRVNVVDPLTRAEFPDNVGRSVPVVNQRIEPDADYLEITAVSLGGGAELMGQAAKVLGVLDGVKGIKRFLVDCVVRTDTGKNCNPQVVGIGIGGSMDVAASLAKQAAILRGIGVRHPNPDIAALEEELTAALNGLGLGPWGIGGKSTVLDVLIETAETHIVTLPVAVYMQCPALRRTTVRFYADGRVEEDIENTWLRRS